MLAMNKLTLAFGACDKSQTEPLQRSKELNENGSTFAQDTLSQIV